MTAACAFLPKIFKPSPEKLCHASSCYSNVDLYGFLRALIITKTMNSSQDATPASHLGQSANGSDER